MGQGSRGGGGGGTPNLIVPDIQARDDIADPKNGLKVWVIDASGDPTVNTGSACYLYIKDTTTWQKTSETESLDLPPATETELGLIEIADSAEVLAGADDGRAITPKKLAEDAATVLAGLGTVANGGRLDVDVDDDSIEHTFFQQNPGADSSGHSSIPQHLSSKWGISNNAFAFRGSYDSSTGIFTSTGGGELNISQSAGNGSTPSGIKYVSTNLETGWGQAYISGANTSRGFGQTGKKDKFGFYIWKVDPAGIGAFAFFTFFNSSQFQLRVWSADPEADSQIQIKDEGVSANKLNDDIIGDGLRRNDSDNSLEVAVDDSTTINEEIVDTSRYSNSGIQSDENALWGLPYISPGISWNGTYLSFNANGSRFVEFNPGTTPIPIPEGDYYLVSPSTGINFQWAFGTLNNVSFVEIGQLSDGTYLYKSSVIGGSETAQGAKSSSGGTIQVRLASGNPQIVAVRVKDEGITLNKLDPSVQDTLTDVAENKTAIDNLLPQHIHANTTGFNVSQEAIESNGFGFSQAGNTTSMVDMVLVIDFKHDGSSGDKRILTQYVDAVSNFWGIILDQAQQGIQLLGGGSNSISTDKPFDNKWHTLALKMNDGRLYRDGSQITQNSNVPTNLNAPIAVCHWNGAFHYTLPVRNFRIFQGAGITATDISKYKSGSDIMNNGVLIYKDIGVIGGIYGNFDFGSPSRSAKTAESLELALITGERIDDSVIGEGLKRNSTTQGIDVDVEEQSITKSPELDETNLTNNTQSAAIDFNTLFGTTFLDDNWGNGIYSTGDSPNFITDTNNSNLNGVGYVAIQNTGASVGRGEFKTFPANSVILTTTNVANDVPDENGDLWQIEKFDADNVGVYRFGFQNTPGDGTRVRFSTTLPIKYSVRIKDAGVSAVKINDDVIGEGLVRNETTQAIEVNDDDSTLTKGRALDSNKYALGESVHAVMNNAFGTNFTSTDNGSATGGLMSTTNGIIQSRSGPQNINPFVGYVIASKSVTLTVSPAGGTLPTYSFTHLELLEGFQIYRFEVTASGLSDSFRFIAGGTFTISVSSTDPRNALLRIKEQGVIGDKLADSVFGKGLKRNATTSGIDVNTDEVSIENRVPQYWDNSATTVSQLFAFLYGFTSGGAFSFMPGSLSNGVFSSANDSGNQKLEFSGSMSVSEAPEIWALSTRDLSEFGSQRIRFNGGTVYGWTQEGVLGSDYVWKSVPLPTGTFENMEFLVSGNNPYTIKFYDIDPRESYLQVKDQGISRDQIVDDAISREKLTPEVRTELDEIPVADEQTVFSQDAYSSDKLDTTSTNLTTAMTNNWGFVFLNMSNVSFSNGQIPENSGSGSWRLGSAGAGNSTVPKGDYYLIWDIKNGGISNRPRFIASNNATNWSTLIATIGTVYLYKISVSEDTLYERMDCNLSSSIPGSYLQLATGNPKVTQFYLSASSFDNAVSFANALNSVNTLRSSEYPDWTIFDKTQGIRDEFENQDQISSSAWTFDANSTTFKTNAANGDLVSIPFFSKITANFVRAVILHDDTGESVINTDLQLHVSRDNGSTYTQVNLIDNGEVYGHGSGLGVDQVPLMTSPTSPSGIVTASSEIDSNRAGYKVFNNAFGAGGSNDHWLTSPGITVGSLKYEFPSPTIISGITIRSSQSSITRAPRDWIFEGSNDGTNYTPLDTQTNQSFAAGELKTYLFTNNTAYLHYRFNVSANNGDSSFLEIGELEFLGAAPPIKALTTSDVDLQAQPEGTQMVWKLVSLNGKNQIVHGIWLQWRENENTSYDNLKDGAVSEQKLSAPLQQKINNAFEILGTFTDEADLESNFPAADNSGKWALINNVTPKKIDGVYRSNGTVYQKILDDSAHPIGDLSLIYNALSGIGSGSVDILNSVAGNQAFRTANGATGNSVPNIFDSNDSSAATMNHSGASATHGDMFIEKFFSTGSYALNKFRVRSQNGPWPQDTLSLFNIQGYDGSNWISLNLLSADGVGSLNNATDVSFGNGESIIVSSNNTAYLGYRIRNFGYTNNDTTVQSFEGFESIDLSETINLTDSINQLHDMVKNFGEWIEDSENPGLSLFDYDNHAIIKYNDKLYLNISGGTVSKGSSNPSLDTSNWRIMGLDIIGSGTDLTNLESSYPAANYTGLWAIVQGALPLDEDGLYQSNGTSWIKKLDDSDFKIGDRTQLFDFEAGISYGSTNDLLLTTGSIVTVGTFVVAPPSVFINGNINDVVQHGPTFVAGSSIGKSFSSPLVLGKFHIYNEGQSGISYSNGLKDFKIEGLVSPGGSWVKVPLTGASEEGSIINTDEGQMARWDGDSNKKGVFTSNNTTGYYGYRVVFLNTHGSNEMRIREFEGYSTIDLSDSKNTVNSINLLRDQLKGFENWIEDPENAGKALYAYPVSAIVKFGALFYQNISGGVIPKGCLDPATDMSNWASLGDRTALWDYLLASQTFGATNDMSLLSGTVFETGSVASVGNAFDDNTATVTGIINNGDTIGKTFDAGVVFGKFMLSFSNSVGDYIKTFALEARNGAGAWNALQPTLLEASHTGYNPTIQGTDIDIGTVGYPNNYSLTITTNNVSLYDQYRFRLIANGGGLGGRVTEFAGFITLPAGQDINVQSSINKIRDQIKGYENWIEDPSDAGKSLYDYEAKSIVRFDGKLYKNISGSTVVKGSTDPSVDTVSWSEYGVDIVGSALDPTDLETNFPAANYTNLWAIVQHATPKDEDGLYQSNGTVWVKKLDDSDFKIGDRTALWNFSTGIAYGGSNDLFSTSGTTHLRNNADSADVAHSSGPVSNLFDNVVSHQVNYFRVVSGNLPALAYKEFSSGTLVLGRFTIYRTGHSASTGNDLVNTFQIIAKDLSDNIVTITPTLVTGFASIQNTNEVHFDNTTQSNITITVDTLNTTPYKAYGIRVLTGGPHGVAALGEMSGYATIDTSDTINLVDSLNRIRDQVKGFENWIEDPGNTGKSLYEYAQNALVKYSGKLYVAQNLRAVGTDSPAVDTTNWHPFSFPIKIQDTDNATVNMAVDDDLLRVNTTSSIVTIALADVSSSQIVDGQLVTIKDEEGNAATNNVLINPQASQFVDESHPGVHSNQYRLTANYEAATFRANKSKVKWEAV